MITILALLFLLIIFSLVTLFPTYFIFSSKLGTIEAELKEVSRRVSDQGIGGLIKVVGSTNQKLKILSSPGQGPAVGEVLEKLVGHARGFVSIQTISIDAAGEVLISGTAPSRQKFLDFTLLLEKEPFFSKVDSPISNLTAVRGINFRVPLLVATSSRRSF